MENKTVKIRFDSIEENSFMISNFPKDLQAKLNKGDVGFNINFGLIFDEKNQSIGVPIVVKAIPIIEKDKYPLLMEFESIIWYKVLNFEEAIKKDEDGDFSITQSLLELILPPAYSTVRGIIFARVSHTYLSKFILPIADSKKLINGLKRSQQ